MQKSTATVKRRKSSNGKGVESGADTSFSDGHASTINSDGSNDIDVGKTLSEKTFFKIQKIQNNFQKTFSDVAAFARESLFNTCRFFVISLIRFSYYLLFM